MLIDRRALLFGVAPLLAQTPEPAPVKSIPDRGPALAAELVKAYVIAGHGNLERTKELLTREPGLLNATHDWGGGDFETALGGASHMGNREIAEFLIGQGARMDLFAAAMLGKLDVVRAAVAAFPGVHRSLGPHRIPLIAHAVKGGAAATQVVEYLRSVGAAV